MAPYHILSMDGGGIRGLLTVTVLERLEAARPGFIEKFDLFAGTSTGGLLALGLASGLTPTQVRDLYERCGRQVFADNLLDDIRDLHNLIGADYSIRPLKEILTEHFGGMTLADLPKKVLVSSFDLDNEASDPSLRTWKAKFFHNYPFESDGDQTVVDVAIRTSAAPTFFPIYQGYVDGGVVVTSPSVCALAQALHPPTGGQQLSDIVLLSMGTGHNPNFIKQKDADWGLVQWAPRLVSLMLEGCAGLSDYQCRQILNDCYFRLDTLLPGPIEMDDVDQMPLLVSLAEAVDLTSALAWIDRYF